jgi:hypothetical protein
MKIIKERWNNIFSKTRVLDKLLLAKGHKITQTDIDMNEDMKVAEELMKHSEVIIIPSSTILELIYNIDRIDCRGHLHLPYPHVLIQFTTPIPEVEIMAHEEIDPVMESFGIKKDSVEGLLLSSSYQDTKGLVKYEEPMLNSLAFFESTAINRVAWKATSKLSIPFWEVNPNNIGKDSLDNKIRLIQLAYVINLFLNAPNITVQKTVFDVRVQRKREQKGKSKLSEYHTVVIEKMQVEYSGKRGEGTPHSRMYPVRGHFRKYKHLDKPVWIANHFRGLAHADEGLSKSIYKVPPKDRDKSSK